MRENLGAYSIFQRCNDASAIGVIFWVCSENKLNIQRQPYGKPTYLHIAFLQNIEKCNLNPRLQIGQFIDYENATVASRNHPEMNHAVIGICQFQVCGFYWVNVANNIGDG